MKFVLCSVFVIGTVLCHPTPGLLDNFGNPHRGGQADGVTGAPFKPHLFSPAPAPALGGAFAGVNNGAPSNSNLLNLEPARGIDNSPAASPNAGLNNAAPGVDNVLKTITEPVRAIGNTIAAATDAGVNTVAQGIENVLKLDPAHVIGNALATPNTGGNNAAPGVDSAPKLEPASVPNTCFGATNALAAGVDNVLNSKPASATNTCSGATNIFVLGIEYFRKLLNRLANFAVISIQNFKL